MTLRDLIPEADRLGDATAMQIDRRLGGLATVSDSGERYVLTRSAGEFRGTATLHARSGPGIGQRDAIPILRGLVAPITLPAVAVENHLRRLATVGIIRHPYQRVHRMTDVFPGARFVLTLPSGTILAVFSGSTDTDRVPWGLEYNGQTYTVAGDGPAHLEAPLEPHLLKPALTTMVQKLRAEVKESLRQQFEASRRASLTPGPTMSVTATPRSIR